MFPERTWVMVDGIYRYNFMEKIYTGIYNNRFEHLLPVQTVPVLGQVKKLSLSRGKRLYVRHTRAGTFNMLMYLGSTKFS